MASLPGDGLFGEPGEKLPGVLAPAAESIERKGDEGGPRFLRGRAVFTAFGRLAASASRSAHAVPAARLAITVGLFNMGQTTVTSIQTGGAPSI